MSDPLAVVITGGSRGLGRAIAEACAAEGMDVMAVARTFPTEGWDPRIRQLCCDLSVPTQRRGVAERCAATLGRIDGWINNAGMAKHGPLVTAVDGDVRQVFEVNVFAALDLAVQAMPHLQKSKGSLIQMASTLGIRTAKERGVYAATKAALISLTQTLALEHGKDGVRVNAIAPGVIETDMVHGGPGQRADAATIASLTKLHPLGRLGEPREVANAVLYLLRAPWTTGAVLTVDGGLLSA